jgi:hypothetical protein
MRTVRRPRRYVAQHWLTLLAPAFAYDYARDAYILRGIGEQLGPVLRLDRRTHADADNRRRRRREQHLEGLDIVELDRRSRRRTSTV